MSLTLGRMSTVAAPPKACMRCILQALRLTSSGTRRPFSTTGGRQSWLLPKQAHPIKDRKGRPNVQTGGSMRGTTVVWGDYGIRMIDHDRRISAAQFKIGEDAIKQRLRGMEYRLYTRLSANTAVHTSGNEVRMGKGKGSFDYWASRVAVSKIIFELKGNLHEKVVRDAFRLAGNKMPGLYEFVKKGDPPVMGITKVHGHVTVDKLRRPRRTSHDISLSKDLPIEQNKLLHYD